MNKLELLMKLNKVEQPKKEMRVVEITREDFDLLDVEQEVIYHIYELDGTMTIKKGINQ